MSMQTDVNAIGLAATESIGGRVRVKGILISYAATTGAIELTDGVGGASKFAFVAPAVDGAVYIPVPGEGIRFENSVYAAEVTDCTLTVFYG